VKSPQQNSIYQWLTEEVKNGWNNKVPSWNFTKYVVNEQGVLTNYFGPSISPTGGEMLKAIKD
jgi:glutathione peroxidase